MVYLIEIWSKSHMQNFNMIPWKNHGAEEDYFILNRI